MCAANWILERIKGSSSIFEIPRLDVNRYGDQRGNTIMTQQTPAVIGATNNMRTIFFGWIISISPWTYSRSEAVLWGTVMICKWYANTRMRRISLNRMRNKYFSKAQCRNNRNWSGGIVVFGKISCQIWQKADQNPGCWRGVVQNPASTPPFWPEAKRAVWLRCI